MTDQEHLERAYRLRLAWYPREFRDEHGPEILAVLMAGARDGQRRPGLAGSADLIRGGLWLRLIPGVPRSARTVRAAVWLMCAGAVLPAVSLILSLISPTTKGIVGGLVVTGLWLGMARANGQGRNGARILSVVMFGVTTLALAIVVFGLGGPGHVAGMTVPSLIPSMLNWLIGLAALCLLWLPASTAYFRPSALVEAQRAARMVERARIAAVRY
ncbi:MAG TPA: hypothetical protein VIX15_11705 [Streptosporangiaceae bacterium]